MPADAQAYAGMTWLLFTGRCWHDMAAWRKLSALFCPSLRHTVKKLPQPKHLPL